jgi:hypothetical protein
MSKYYNVADNDHHYGLPKCILDGEDVGLELQHAGLAVSPTDREGFRLRPNHRKRQNNALHRCARCLTFWLPGKRFFL